jgi:aspartate/methionine/tyrosine aminotransferase
MTEIERDFYLGRVGDDVLDLASGYPPAPMMPDWMTEHQLNRPADFLSRPAWEYMAVIRRYFEDWFSPPSSGAPLSGYPDVHLTPTCTRAFEIAVRTLMRRHGDEFILVDRSFEPWPKLIRSFGARPVFVRRGVDGAADPDAIRAACTRRTRAVILVIPDNPWGTCPSPEAMAAITSLCRERHITLLADHALATVNPLRRHIPVVSRELEPVQGLSWLELGDTSKILGLEGSKFGAVVSSPGWRDRVEAIASEYYFQYSRQDLYEVASIMDDSRFRGWASFGFGTRISHRLAWLRDELKDTPLTVHYGGAGSFALIDGAGLGLTDLKLTAVLQERYKILVLPVSCFPSGRPGCETSVRFALARPPGHLGQLIDALKNLARLQVSRDPSGTRTCVV